MIIADGYTIYGSFDGRKFAIRPALHCERVEFWRGHRTQENVVNFINQHVVWKDGLFLDKAQEALFLICFGTIAPEHGGDWSPNWESRDARNLWEGVILETLSPSVAHRDCGECKKWWFNEDTGRIVERGGKKLLRPLDAVTLCQTHEGCPKGTPENQKGLSPKNKTAWRHFQECEAVGSWPDDPIVRHNARIIRRAMKEATRRGR
jgi:hypothetical protein